jgi:predicted outer membrane protein
MKKHLLLAACSLAAALVLIPDEASAQVVDSTKKDTAAVRPVPPPPTQDRPAAARPAGAISDSAIIAMLQLSHQKEIAAAEEAIQRASSDRVKRFAETLKIDHSKALADLEAYAERMGGMSSGVRTDSAAKVATPDSLAQKPAEAPAAATPDSSQGVAGHEFDHGFVRLQVQQHETEINHLRNDVIPMIKDSGLKALVQRELPILGRHLTMARELEGFLKTTN